METDDGRGTGPPQVDDQSRKRTIPTSRGRVLAAGAALALTALLTSGAPVASAVMIDVPSDSTRAVDTTLTLGSEDPTGQALLVIDGRVVRSMPCYPDSTVRFSGTAVAPGTHRVRATLRSPEGTRRSVNQVLLRAWGVPGAPGWLNPPAGYAGSRVSARVRAGSWTTSMTLIVNGRVIRHVDCSPRQACSMGTVSLPKGTSTFTLVEANPFGEVRTYSKRVRRITWPWPTCVIIDKSQRRLYWVRNGVLVKVYPVAIGKPSTPTPCRVWKVLSKERTDPRGVYGPRKLRLYKRVGSSYVRTGYGIHGTNEPWVIGTMASHGCIRMYNRHILELWPQVPRGTMVLTRR